MGGIYDVRRWDGLRCHDIVTYPGFAWLIRRVLDLTIEFIGPLYNWLQQFKNHYLTLSSSSDWTLPWNYSDFQLHSVVLLPFWSELRLTMLSYNSSARTLTENTVFCCQEYVFIGPLPSNGCPIVDSACFGNVFTEPLLSNGHIPHIILTRFHKDWFRHWKLTKRDIWS
jgi:hypothetical protein